MRVMGYRGMSMSNRPAPERSYLDDLTGHRIAGGCEDCTAYQTVTDHGDGLYVLTIHHDETCPSYRKPG